MRPSIFNASVPLPDGNVFLLNTLTDAQAILSADVARLLERLGQTDQATRPSVPDQGDVLETLAAQGFLVESLEADRQALVDWFREFREDTSQLRVTVLTTLQCNFACGYCIQGEHGDHNARAAKMSSETADLVAGWIEARLDEIRPRSFVLTFFGGEPLLNLPATYRLAERLWTSTQARRVRMGINVITNGLLLTPEVVDTLNRYGLNGVKVTLDGDREAHDVSRPLRGGQGTFDRIIENLRRIAGRCPISIGGNFEAALVDRYPALLAYLREQPFASSIAKVAFKPVIRNVPAPAPALVGGASARALPVAAAAPASGPRMIPLVPAAGSRGPGGSCMTAAGAGGSPCDTCHVTAEPMAFLREETRRHGFSAPDGLHMGPCEMHRRHAYTVGPDGTLFACPGFAGEDRMAVGRVSAGEPPDSFPAVASRFERVAAWKQCGDCAFIPVCAGGCTAASHHELGDIDAPTCHKPSFQSALVTLAHESAGVSGDHTS